MYSIGYYLKPKTIATAEHRQQPKGIAKESRYIMLPVGGI